MAALTGHVTCENSIFDWKMASESKIVDQEFSSRQIGLLENISNLKNTLSQIKEYFEGKDEWIE